MSTYPPNTALPIYGVYTQAGASSADLEARLSVVSTVINVQDPAYGAKGDGATDDTAAIRLAVAAAQALRYATVYFPPPSAFYKVTGTVSVTGPIRLVGAHRGVAIKAVGMSAGTFVLDVGDGSTNLEGVGIERLTLLSDNQAPDLIRLNHAALTTLRDVRLYTARHGITITGTRGHDTAFDRLECYGLTGNGVYVTNFTGGGQETFSGCSFTACNFGIVVDSASTVTGMRVQALFEQCTGAGIDTVGTVHGLDVSGSRFEKNALDIDLRPSAGNSVYGVSVRGNFFNSNNVAQAIVIGGNTGLVRGFEITGNYAEIYSTQFVLLNGEGSSGEIANNRLHSVPAVVNQVRAGVRIVNNEGDSGVLSAIQNPPLTPVSADRGDANVTLVAGVDSTVQRFATTLTANRTVTLPASASAGDTFRIVRTGLGAYTLSVSPLKIIPSATQAFVEAQYDGSAWQLIGYGTL